MLNNETKKGFFWSAIEKFSVQIGQFVIGIVLARLLSPDDFGLIGMLSIFIAISQSFIDSGMGSGLIQKKNKSDIDFSTVFIFNFAVSVIFYLILFVSSPYIATFYKIQQLESLTRILGLNIIINSLTIVQRTKLTIDLNFKAIAKVNVFTLIISGVIALTSACFGLGVWALVIQTISNSVFSLIIFWYFSKWNISLKFSTQSFKELFGFGSKLLIASVYAQILNNIYNIIIGKVYKTSDLGYYTRSKMFAEMASGTVSSVLFQVTFPVLASLQDDKEKLVSVYRKIIRMTSFFVFPTMTLLAILSEPLIVLLLTDKWAPAIVLFQWMCFARFFYPISVINMNILNATGRSDLYLKVDLAKLPLTILSLLIAVPIGVKAIVISHVIVSFISFFINAYLPGKIYGYGPWAQLKDMLPIFISTAIMAIFVIFTNNFIENDLLKILFSIFIAITVYLFVSIIFKVSGIEELRQYFNSLISKLWRN